MHILKQNGLEVPEDVITVEEGIEILSALLQTGGVKSCH